MRAMWSGSLNFGLVNIPVQLYTATDDQGLDLNMLHKEDLSPIRFARICRAEEREIPYSEIVRGYEYEKGKYVALDEEDLQKVDVEKTGSINITDFSSENEIDSIYFEKPYYLEPDKGAEKAYALLREALKQSKKVGIARFVLKNREHLGVVKCMGKVLVLNQIRYNDEVRDSHSLKLPDAKNVGKREIDMALKLIEQLTHSFKPDSYKDTYTEQLLDVINQKSRGKAIRKPAVKEHKPARVTDLMATLRASLAHKRGSVISMEKYRRAKGKSRRKAG